MTYGEEKARRDARMAEMIAATGFERGDSRPPVFGEQIMGVWAGESNPQRVGKYVETRRRTGRLNPGVWYRLTDGRGSFWEYEASQTLFVPTRPAPETRSEDWPRDGNGSPISVEGGVIVKNGYCADCGGINEHYDHCLSKEPGK